MKRRTSFAFPVAVVALLLATGHAMEMGSPNNMEIERYVGKLCLPDPHYTEALQSNSILRQLEEAFGIIRSLGLETPVVCKFSPYRVCYHLDEDGKLYKIAGPQPLNTLRVYKKRSMGIHLARGRKGKRPFHPRMSQKRPFHPLMVMGKKGDKVKRQNWSTPSHICWSPPC